MKTQTSHLFLAATMLVANVSFATPIPQDAKKLLEQYSRAEEKLNEQFKSALTKLKIKYTKRGDLDSANAINDLLNGSSKDEEAQKPKDVLTGTSWTFLGINKQSINEFTFLKDGIVKCKNTYRSATWKRIDEDTILFAYGLRGSPHIVFHIKDARRKNMTGYNSENGRVRYLVRK